MRDWHRHASDEHFPGFFRVAGSRRARALRRTRSRAGRSRPRRIQSGFGTFRRRGDRDGRPALGEPERPAARGVLLARLRGRAGDRRLRAQPRAARDRRRAPDRPDRRLPGGRAASRAASAGSSGRRATWRAAASSSRCRSPPRTRSASSRDTFNRMQQQLRRVDVARKEFIATASHELRTPIFSLGGFVELLQDEDLDEETRREFLDTMSEQVARLQKLSVDLLDLSRLDSGSVELHTEPVDLAELTRSIAGEFHPRLAEHRHGARAGRAGRGPERELRPRAGGPDHADPARQRPPPHPGGHRRDRERDPLQRRHRAHGGGRRPRPAGRRARARSSSASTPATRPEAPGSALPSLASWRSGWRGASCSRRSRAARPSRSSCRPTATAREARGGGGRRGSARRGGGLRLERRRRRHGASAAGRSEVTTTRVQVVEGLGRDGRFDPASIYDRLSPGVVTILSLFGGGTSLLEDGGEGGQGSGFVIDGEGYIATNAHVVTTDRGDTTERADQVYVEFSDGNRVPARIVGHDPNADVALLKVEPDGPLAHAAAARRVRLDRGRGAGRGDRQPVRRAPVALDGRDLGARPDDRVAHAVRDRRRDPDGRAPSTRATPAGRCSTPRAA